MAELNITDEPHDAISEYLLDGLNTRRRRDANIRFADIAGDSQYTLSVDLCDDEQDLFSIDLTVTRKLHAIRLRLK